MCEMWRFSVVRSLASFMNEVAKYQLANVAGFLIFLIGKLPEKSCFLFGVAFAIPRYKCKASKAWYRQTTMQYRLQITTAKRLQVMEEIHCNM